MNRFDAPDSLFAPIFAAVPPDTAWAGFASALTAAEQAVPVGSQIYWVKTSGFSKRQHHIRERVLTHFSDPKPFTKHLVLFDRAPGATATLATRHWEVGMVHLKDGLLTPAVPADYDSAVLTTSMICYSSNGLTGGPQLALLRHLWAASVLAASKDAIVFGGQHDWRDEWWTEERVAQPGAES